MNREVTSKYNNINSGKKYHAVLFKKKTAVNIKLSNNTGDKRLLKLHNERQKNLFMVLISKNANIYFESSYTCYHL